MTTSFLVTSYLIVNIVGQSPGGKLGDVLGHSLTVRLEMILYAAGALTGLFAERLSLLIVSRGTMALGGAFVVPATMALLRVHVPAERRGRVFGMVGATMGLSAAIGPPLGGEIVTRFGWRGIFGSRATALGGAIPLLSGLLLLSRVGTFQTPRGAAPALALLGIGIGLSGAPLQAAAMASVGAKEAGMAAGATSTMRYVGGVVSILMLSAILGEGHAASVAAHEGAIRMFTAGAVVATFACLGLPGRASG